MLGVAVLAFAEVRPPDATQAVDQVLGRPVLVEYGPGRSVSSATGNVTCRSLGRLPDVDPHVLERELRACERRRSRTVADAAYQAARCGSVLMQ